MTSEISATYSTPLTDKPLQELNRIAQRPPLDIDFQDLSYSVRASAKGGWRQILKSVNGKFRCGEFTAIMGPSGAGKSTLLNILAGYVTAGVQGSIKINDRPRDMKIFNKLSSYIMQEDIIQPRLTVKEAMMFAACLKLGTNVSRRDKIAVVEEVINLLGLEFCVDTRSEYLSGGQRKRLAVALELVNNPPVIFLDEPTTGLDNFAIKQCIDLLKKISNLDRTVICTIHQPPSSLFNQFDQVYVVADGYCVYSGSPGELVPFLSTAGYACPENNTPAEYIIELVHQDPYSVRDLAAAINNGKTLMLGENSKKQRPSIPMDDIYQERTITKRDMMHATPFHTQFWLILNRMFIQMSRNRLGLYIQFFHHLLSGVLIGSTFYDTGNNAVQMIAVFKYCISVNVFFMYTYTMLPVLLFPLEVKLLRREYFNRWYGLKAYYTALTVASLPLMLVLSVMFTTIVYFMSGQPVEIERFFGFTLMGLTIALTSQGLGYAIGSIFNITKGSIVGPSVLGPLLALAVYGMGYRAEIAPFMQFLMSLTFLRFGIVGFLNTLFHNRETLECPEEELYCHYSRPSFLMKDMGMPVTDYKIQLGYILLFSLIFRVSAYLSLKFRLNFDLSSKLVYYVNKIVEHKH